MLSTNHVGGYKSVIYTKNQLEFTTFLGLYLYFMYLSNIHSSREWCSKYHILSHTVGHLFGAVGVYAAIK